VIVTTHDEAALDMLATDAPQAFRLLSVSSSERFAALQADLALQRTIDGVTIQHTLLNEETAGWLRERNMTILAWTVNDLERVNELVALGVNAVTTDNLAILELLGGYQHDEALLERATSRRNGSD
jgi:glycerophosphoryl diester phosphodiesterase